MLLYNVSLIQALARIWMFVTVSLNQTLNNVVCNITISYVLIFKNTTEQKPFSWLSIMGQGKQGPDRHSMT